jgi:hypothetical protein
MPVLPKLFALSFLLSFSPQARADIGWWQDLECSAKEDILQEVSLTYLHVHVGFVSTSKRVALTARQKVPYGANKTIYFSTSAGFEAEPSADFSSLNELMADERDFTVRLSNEKITKRIADNKVYRAAGYPLNTDVMEADVEVTILDSPQISAFGERTGVSLAGKVIKKRMSCKSVSKVI